MDTQRTARTLKQNLQYIHVNCREFRGSLFMILKQVLQKFTPQFPQRGFSSEELLHILLDQLETKNLHIILTLDEAEDRKSTRLNSSHTVISYAVFCLKKKIKKTTKTNRTQV